MARTEIELKFQLPRPRRDALRRALGRSAAVQRLRARYLDTPEQSLAAAGLALRLRHEGDRWVQTLKGRGDGLAERLEDEVPLPPLPGRGEPTIDPNRHDGTAAGAALMRALDGAGPLALRFATDIRRTRRVLRHQGARIEIALDEGWILAAGRRAAVCEVEFELLAGPRSALWSLAAQWALRHGLVLDTTSKAERGHRLADGIAHPPAVGAQPVVLPADAEVYQGRAAMAAAALAQALPNASALATGGGDAEHVHQLRVGLRRLRAVLRAFGPAAGPDDAERDAALGTLFAALGDDRDRVVLQHTLRPAMEAARSSGLAAPRQPAAAAAPAGAGQAVQALREPGTTWLWLRLLALTVPTDSPGGAGAETPALLAEAAPAALQRLRRSCRRDIRRFAELDDPARHALRKRLKRLRYLLEACASVLPRRATRRELERLAPLQDALGRWHDLVVAQAALAARARPSAAERFAQGWLAREVVLALAACGRTGQRWRRVSTID